MDRDLDAGVIDRAFEFARTAGGTGDRPRAAVARSGTFEVVRHDESQSSGDPTAHAIALALTELAHVIGTRRLRGVTIYATHEPCSMCAGALVASGVDRLVFSEPDPVRGAAGSRYNMLADPRLGHEVAVTIVNRRN